MANYNIIGGDGKQYGPVSADDLRRWIIEERLNAQSLVKAESDAEFRPVSTFPEFADVLRAQAATGEASSQFTDADWLERDYELDIGSCISRSWELVKKNFWPVTGVTALVFVLIMIVNQLTSLITRPAINAMVLNKQVSAGAILLMIGVSFITAPIFVILVAGLFKYYLKLIRNEGPTISDAFAGFGPSLGQLILLGLVVNICTLIGYSLCIIPGIYLQVSWLFATPLVIDRQMNFWQAMELSRKMVGKHWFLVFALFLVASLLAVSGVIACCVGVFVTLAIGIIAQMYAYETIFNAKKN